MTAHSYDTVCSLTELNLRLKSAVNASWMWRDTNQSQSLCWFWYDCGYCCLVVQCSTGQDMKYSYSQYRIASLLSPAKLIGKVITTLQLLTEINKQKNRVNETIRTEERSTGSGIECKIKRLGSSKRNGEQKRGGVLEAEWKGLNLIGNSPGN